MVPSISYAITAYNESEELKRLLGCVYNNKTELDEIVVQLDTTATYQVRTVVNNMFEGKVKVIEFPLNKDFAAFKNNLINSCTKDYIVFIDADEYMESDFLLYLPVILEENPAVDMYRVARWNTVEGLTNEHISKWGWHVDSLDRINWPDRQTRIMKNNTKIKWVGKVHERLEGYKVIADFPEELCLIHPKDIKRQEKQNSLYQIL
jgi:glycosyltransferase involved in cell wall biosynthesis